MGVDAVDGVRECRGTIIRANSVLRVRGVDVNRSGFDEKYGITFATERGVVTTDRLALFRWNDGSPFVAVEDLRRWMFFGPSQLMRWPDVLASRAFEKVFM